MEQNLNAGGWNNSLTPSTRLLNQKLGTSPAPRHLTPSEIELLRSSKRELAALAFATPTRALRLSRAALDNPDLPVSFVAESLLSLDKPRENSLPFVPRSGCMGTQQT